MTTATFRRVAKLGGPLRFTVNGVPIPKGSMRGYWVPSLERVVLTSDNDRLSDWDAKVSGDALDAAGRMLRLQGPIRLTVRFRLPAPADAPKRRRAFATHKPDGDKLLRAVCDALSVRAPSSKKRWVAGSVWRDDAQVVEYHVYKELAYDDQPGVDIEVEELPHDTQGRWCVEPAMEMLPSQAPRPLLEAAKNAYRSWYAARPTFVTSWLALWLVNKGESLANCSDEHLATFPSDLLAAVRSARQAK